MNKVISILKKYFNEDDINKILKELDQKQRVTIINDNYFAKVGNDSNKVFFNNLVNEIKLYENNQDNLVLPKIVDSYVSDKYTLIVLKKVNGKTLSDQRNNYNIHLSHSMRHKIARSVLEIKYIKIKCELNKKYNRKELLNKYLERVKNYLSKKTFLKIMSLSNYISKESKNIVISHGDLVPTNIILDKDIIKFVDWEYISYKPEFYDITYFLMFSKKRHSLKIIDELNIDNNEVYKDAIILCLKEISNWIKLYGEINNYIINKNIRRWKRELNYILKRIKY